MPIQIPLFLSSTLSGVRITENGSTGTFTLSQPIRLDPTKKNLLAANRSTFWNVNPNISAALGNNVLEWDTGVTTYHITFEDGLYGLSEINEVIANFLYNQEVPNPNNYIVFGGDEATGKVYVFIANAGIDIDWTSATIGSILGYVAPGDNIDNADPDEVYYASTKAMLNNVQNVYVHTNIATGGCFGNQVNADVLMSCPLTVSAGLQQISEPRHRNFIVMNTTEISAITVYFTDDVGRKLNFGLVSPEPWSLDMIIQVED